MLSVDEKWKNFLLEKNITENNNGNISKTQDNTQEIIHKTTLNKTHFDSTQLKFDINISTKTKTLFFNKLIDIYNIFWNIPIVNYSSLTEGVIKKEIKIVNNSKEETELFEEKLKKHNPLYFEPSLLPALAALSPAPLLSPSPL